MFRSFVVGSPLSVQQPANLAKIQLVDTLQPEHWKACGPVMFPIRCDVPWGQSTRPNVLAYMAIPPNHNDAIGKVEFEVFGLDGKPRGHYEGKIETFEQQGNFRRASAQWPTEIGVPGATYVLGIVYDKSGKELTRIAPRLVSVNMNPGY